ncbi:DUF808 domain-containing protein [Calidifontibacter sp. DB0510]|uniref:DUF808 domain-containing protein n=1 Tax=Metallococcus carri TaxID=1656884 RepID=A0A967AXJ5_9MICO|nr:DUF808 domain-containing protein [Metallococcus carri]NHN54563.1 DUF808 domain-containing protein [Metallococcus carri]NOP36598.1 DUF808 family protein [Calidifontibacter sp. DB2511S]
MAGGLVALLDDVAALAKAAAASVDDVGVAAGRASVKATGVVVDDTAVTPRYVEGIAAERELPIIKKIAIGSLRNKLLVILPVALILSQFLPWALTPILMLGGTYLCFEGAEKILERFTGGHEDGEQAADEDQLVKGAVRTDLILSSEIMVISLNEVASQGFWARAAILIVVAILITILVYGVVALIVKMDDVGLHLSRRDSAGAKRLGRGLVKGMPKVMSVLSTVGIVAMLWVGGHILLVGADELGWKWPYSLVHHAEVAVEGVPGVGGILVWLVGTLCAAIAGAIVGSIVVAILKLVRRPKSH